MLTNEKLKILQDLISTSSKEEIIWLNGYIAGLIAQSNEPADPVAQLGANDQSLKPQVGKITIAYGTETGNSKKLATDFAAKAKKNGIHAKMVSLDQYRLDDLHKEEYFFTVISTQGDGEPPAAAKKFYDHIHKNGFQLHKLKYGVLALGDTAYPLFCKAGEDVDLQLQKLGGERIASLQKCDTDYDSDAGKWFAEILQKLSGASGQKTSALPISKKHTGKTIYSGKILTNIILNDKGSNKQTHHIEIAADHLDYQPGDSIGIIPHNHDEIVHAIISLANIDQDKLLTHRNKEWTLFELLKKKLNIVHLPERVVKKYAAIVQQDIPETKISLLDLLKIYSLKDTAQFEEVISILEPIIPRLYSIASSPQAHEGEVHITVALDTFTINEEIKCGLCSDFLSQLTADRELEFYVHKNAQFKLPPPDKNMIMIGPGTGIAPFRSFLAERDSTGATGKNWLFFGDQHFATDFLYQTEIQHWIQTEVLTKVNVAFSRDKKEKVYVQHKMQKHGEEFFDWLNQGAYVYVCGAKEPMSVDVEHTLLGIIRQFGHKNEEQTNAYLDELKESGRYVKDVY
ncbi:MAG TPA: flavodoxin domain-containing protein [Puia sp.]|nr:flavodoxin domain-containing protein [Puia sp.]